MNFIKRMEPHRAGKFNAHLSKERFLFLVKRLVLTMTLLLSSLIFPDKIKGADFLFDASLHNIQKNFKAEKSLIIPWINHLSTKKLMSEGRTILLLEPIRLNQTEWAEGEMRKLPDLYYAVIKYIDYGTYYGFIEIRGVNTSFENFNPLAGKLIKYNKDTINIVRDIEMCVNPSAVKGTYNRYVRDYYLQADYYDESPNQNGFPGVCEYVAQYTFGPNGKFKFTYGADYFGKTPQVSARRYTKRLPNGRRTTQTQLTGGWYYDVKSRLSTTGSWNLKDGILRTRLSSTKPTYSSNATLNTERQKAAWAEEDIWKGEPDPQVKTYRRQLLQQQKSDFPNYMSNTQKNLFLRTLKRMDLPTKQAFVIVGVGGNDMFALPLHSDDFTKVAHFQKDGAASFRFDRNDVAICYDEIDDIYKKTLDSICSTIPNKIKTQFPEGGKIQLGNNGEELSIVDWYVYNFSESLDKADMLLLLRNGESSNILPYTATLEFHGIKPLIQPESLSEFAYFEQIKQAYLAGYKRIEQFMNDKSLKKAKKIASKYKKGNKKKISFEYTTITQFLSLYKLLEEKVAEQESVIKECEDFLKEDEN